MKTKTSIIAAAVCAMLTALPLSAAEAGKTAAGKSAAHAAWRAEMLSGKIVAVDQAKNVIVVKTPDGTPFDFDITHHTRIKSGDHPVATKDLSTDLNKDVSVKFVPERRGDVAESIRISSWCCVSAVSCLMWGRMASCSGVVNPAGRLQRSPACIRRW